MKIYNKKTFAFGVFSAALGVLNAVTAALRGIDAAGVVLVAVLLFVGAGAMMRGLSQKMAREDKLEERDERNRLVELKSKSAAFRLTQAVWGWRLRFLPACWQSWAPFTITKSAPDGAACTLWEGGNCNAHANTPPDAAQGRAR